MIPEVEFKQLYTLFSMLLIVCTLNVLLQKFQHYADVLIDGLKDEHRWWGGWDIFRRLPFVVISFCFVYGRPSLILVSI